MALFYSLEPTPIASDSVQAVEFFDQDGNQVTLNVVPEPRTLLLTGTCLLLCALRRRALLVVVISAAGSIRTRRATHR
jgi:hypothetical protein